MSLTLARALRMEPAACAVFIGAGGKTTAMFKLARELPAAIVTATTHLGIWQTSLADRHIATDEDTIENIEGFQGVLLVTGKPEGERVKPISEKLLHRLHQHCQTHAIPLLVEADGSRQKPLKAWAEHEPPIPEFADLVIHVAGLSGLGKPLSETHVHRAEKFAQLSGLDMGETISLEAIANVLTHPQSGLKNIQKTARRVVLLNQADTPELQSAAHTLTSSLFPTYQAVLISSLLHDQIHAVHEPIAGIVLAAGESKRFGKPKQLLDWKGQSFVRAVAQTALRAGLSPVVVVTGANAGEVEAAVHDLNVLIVRNEDWQSGQGSSIRQGIKALMPPPSLRDTSPKSFGFGGSWEGVWVGGAVFLLTDQPQVTTTVIQALKEKHAEGLYPIVVPLVMDRRCNPVLFDRATFPDLMHIEGDTGGRALFQKHRLEYLPWHDDRLLLDVDTPEQYERLIAMEDL
ncbi:MAG: putative selenium-dependent hydroxylase accessory protein YqeC [Chloroflexi bacterium]|nr:putative selenium-dependent hydroxylase accessory protein YqeC [Chloroflexota bacterium]